MGDDSNEDQEYVAAAYALGAAIVVVASIGLLIVFAARLWWR